MEQVSHSYTSEEIRRRLESAGIQASAPRMAIASYVWSTCSHPTAEDVKMEVEKSFPMVSLATVYNTLKLYVDHGLLIEVRDPRLKSVRYDCNTHPHFHFLDEDSGEIHDLHPHQVKVRTDLPGNYVVSGMDITVRGRKNLKAAGRVSAGSKIPKESKKSKQQPPKEK